MIPNATIEIPADEYLARPAIVAWLAYPSSEYKRNGALRYIGAWAEFVRDCRRGVVNQARDSRGAPVLTTRQVRTEEALRGLERAVNLQLLMGQHYHFRLLDHESEIYDISPVSETGNEFSRKAFWRGLNDSGMMDIDERNARGRLWNDRMPSMALAVGACDWWRGPYNLPPDLSPDERMQARLKMPRPDLENLLFGEQLWTERALRRAAHVASYASQIGHPSAQELLNFRASANF